MAGGGGRVLILEGGKCGGKMSSGWLRKRGVAGRGEWVGGVDGGGRGKGGWGGGGVDEMDERVDEVDEWVDEVDEWMSGLLSG